MKILTAIIKSLFIILLLAGAVYSKTMTILVHPFTNTGDQKFSWLSAGMTDSVISDLGKINDVSTFTEMDRQKVIREMEAAMLGFGDEEKAVKAGMALGADVIFTGSYTVFGNMVRVNAKLINVEKMRTEKSVKIDGTMDKIFDLQDKIVFTLMAETERINIADIKPVKFRDEDRKKIEQEVRPTLSAYELYSKGLEIVNINPNAALNYFKQAIAIEPDYFEAQYFAGSIAGQTLNLFDESFRYFQKAEIILERKGDKNTVAYSILLNRIGIVYRSKGDDVKAFEYYTKAKDILDRLGLQNTDNYSDILHSIGVYYDSKGDQAKGHEYVMEAKEIKDKLGRQNTANYSTLLKNIGAYYSWKGDDAKAFEYWTKAKDILDRLGLQNTDYYSDILIKIGLKYVFEKDFVRGLEYLMKAKEIQDRLGLQSTVKYSEFLIGIGNVYFVKDDIDKGDDAKAFEYYTKAKDILDRLGLQNTDNYSYILNRIGSMYKIKGDYDKALENFMKSKEIQDKLGLQNTEKYSDLLNRIGSIYKSKGDYDKALEYFKKSKKIKDSLARQKAAKDSKMVYYIGILLIIGIVVFLVVMVYRRKSKKKYLENTERLGK
jgi:tetratricopeptide (TPR) repeat protein